MNLGRYGGGVGEKNGKPDNESAAFIFDALYLYLPMHPFNEVFGDREAEAAACVRPRKPGALLLEFLEEMWQEGISDAEARVFDVDFYVATSQPKLESDFALVGELDRVA